METEKKKKNKNKKPSDVEKAIKKLAGAVPYTDLSLEELREERLDDEK